LFGGGRFAEKRHALERQPQGLPMDTGHQHQTHRRHRKKRGAGAGFGQGAELAADAGVQQRSVVVLVVDAGDGVSLLPAGSSSVAPWSEERARSLARTLASHDVHVVVDVGRRGGPSVGQAHEALVDELVAAGRSLLVTRSCYLALRRAVHQRVVADGAVLVREPGRSLDHRDVTQVLGLPMLAQVDLDPAVARSVDAGLLARTPHRALERSLRGLW